MFEWIKNIFWKKEVSKKGYGDYDHNLWGYTFFWDFEKAGKIRKSDLINLFTWYSYVCISAISEWIAWLDRKVFWSENRIDREKKHKYNDLITNSFLEEVVGFLEITWTCYIRKKIFWKSIDSLEVLRTDLVSRRSNWTYDYNYNWTIYNYSDEEVFIIKSFSPFKNGLWFSPLEALWKQQAMDDEIIEWNWSFFKNNASTGTTLQTDQSIEKKDKEYLIWKWKSEFMWPKNGNKVAVLDNWLKEVKNEIGQKDMDFVNQRVMIRDEIFTIFRVPKVVVWITDGVWYTDRMVWKTTFAEFKLKPIAQKIEEALNENIFKWIWFFKFINIVPIDTEQLAEDFRLWAISLNEYRIKKWYANIKDGNKNISWEVLELEEENNKKEKKDFKVEKVLETTIKNFLWKEIEKNREEKLQKRWEQKIARTDKDEKEFNKLINNIFALQEKEILKLIEEKSKKTISDIKEEEIIEETASLILFQKTFKNFFTKLFKREGKIAINEVWDYVFNFAKIEPFIWENIKRFAKDINITTRKEIIQIIKDGVKVGAWTVEINKNIRKKFKEYTTERVNKISRTEISRGVNRARVVAWEQTGVVEYKEWWTALDERVCPHCADMHWKKELLSKDFYKKWDKTESGLSLDYEDIPSAPLHVKCRCDIIAKIK